MKLPTVDEADGLGSGEFDTEFDTGFAGAIEQDIDRFDPVEFVQLDLLGDPDGGIDLGQTLAIASSTPLDGRWGVLLDLSALRLHVQCRRGGAAVMHAARLTRRA